MQSVAVIGATGQLGNEIVGALAEAGYHVRPYPHDHIEVADPQSVDAAFAGVPLFAVINCAAFHRVDECEERPERAIRINALGALHVAQASARAGARCVYISTDYVFGARGAAPYGELDEPSPVNVYGISKTAGEQLVAHACPGSLILRLAGLYGLAGSRGKQGNFVETVLRKARSGQPLRIVDDIRLSPTYARDAADALVRLIAHGATGVVHVANTGSCTWREFAERIVARAGVSADIVPIPSAEYPMKARRPSDSSLHSIRLRDLTGSPTRPWQDALDAYLAERALADGASERAGNRIDAESCASRT